MSTLLGQPPKDGDLFDVDDVMIPFNCLNKVLF